MAKYARIETITKGPSQRVRRTIGYRVVATDKWGGNPQEIARFDVDPSDMDAALTAARQAFDAYKHDNT